MESGVTISGETEDWHERLGRIGFVAQGILYGIVGIIAIAVALGGEKSAADQSGALSSLADSPAGVVLLVLLAVGLAAMALFRIVEVFRGPAGEEADDRKEKLERVASFVRFLIYAGLCVTAVRLVADAGGQSSGGGEKGATSTVFDLPGGVVLVFCAGLVIAGVGIYQGYRGVSTSFEDELDQSRMSQESKHVVRAVGIAGYIARGVVFLLIGGFLIKAAVEHDAKEAIGIDGALQEISQQTLGSLLLLIVAIGLFIFGAYCLIESRYRKL